MPQKRWLRFVRCVTVNNPSQITAADWQGLVELVSSAACIVTCASEGKHAGVNVSAVLDYARVLGKNVFEVVRISMDVNRLTLWRMTVSQTRSWPHAVA
jgi:hypothetical protein